jgi:eukaryotic-like serine/threonine-protein kinase
MELWNEYEGQIIAGTFKLERLLRPEGRSAFFSTSIGNGRSTVLRLIESHYDDDAIIARWDAVARLKQENLLALKKFDHVVMDDTSLVYAVMEPSDADLGQILRERALTVPETRQLAVSLVAALQALHSIGLVHEHLQPINVLAVDETVKLRSDCVREAAEGAEGDVMRARDVHDFAVLLLQALTLERDPDRVLKPSANSSALPNPFREIIYNGISGRWTLATIAKALTDSAPATLNFPTAGPPETARTAPASSTTSASSASAASSMAAASAATSAAAAAATGGVRTAPVGRGVAATPAVSARSSSGPATPPAARSSNGNAPSTATERPAQTQSTPAVPAYLSSASRARVEAGRTTVMEPEAAPPQRNLLRAAIATLVLLGIILLLWRMTHRPSSAHMAAANPPMQTLASMGQTAPRAAAPTAASQGHAATKVAQTTPGRNGTPNWRVIAYTYDLQAQAQAKVGQIAQQNPKLQVEVFAPRGHAPYLVALGGLMTRDEAMALRAQLRGKGFPRDIYAQNYGSHRH